MSHHAFRLLPGADLRTALEDYVVEHKIQAAAVLTFVGSLSVAQLRLADAGSESQWQGPFEIVSLAGTLSPQGSHCHIALADAAGKVRGGHLCYGSVVHTTAEVVVVDLSDYAFGRELDVDTGYRELVISPRQT